MYNKKIVFAASCFGILLFGIVLISLGSILPSLREKFLLSDVSTGSLLSILPFGLLLGSLVFGPIVDRHGYKMLLIACGLLIFAGLEGIALTGSLEVLHASVFLIGIGGGGINGGANALVADISDKDRGAKLSLLGVFFGVGALGMPVLLGFFTSLWSYENILMSIGAFVLLPILFFVFISFPSPKQEQGFPITQGIKLAKDPVLILIGFTLFFQSGLEGLTNNWSTTYLQEEKGLDPEKALFALSYFVIGLTVMRLVLGIALNHIKSYVALAGSIAISILGCAIIIYSKGEVINTIGLIMLGIGLSAGFPVILGYVGSIYSNLSGTAFSIVLAIALVGNMSCNYAMGLIAKAYDIEQLPILLLLCLCGQALILTVIVKRLLAEKKI